MIHIYIGGEALDLPEKYKVTFDSINPALSGKLLPRAFSTDIALPCTARNERLLGHPSRLDANTEQNIPATLDIMGLPWRQGTLTVRSANSKAIKVYFKESQITSEELLNDTHISEVITEVFSVPGDDTHVYHIHGTYALELNWNDEHNGIIHIGDQSFSYSASVAEPPYVALNQLAADINAVYPGIASVVAVPPFSPPPTPPPNRKIVIDLTGMDYPKVYFESTTNLFYDVLPDTRHGADALFENWEDYFQANSEVPHPAWKLPVIRNNSWYDGEGSGWGGIVNYHNGIFHTPGSIGFTDEQGPLRSLSPQISLAYCLEKIAEWLGLALDGEASDPDFMKLYLLSNRSLDRVEYETPVLPLMPDPENPTYSSTPQPSFAISDHLPDLSVAELLEHLANDLNLFYEITEGRLIIRKKEDMVRTDAVDWSHALQVSSQSINFQEREGWEMEFEERDHDTYSNALPQKYREQGGRGTTYVLHSYPLHSVGELYALPIVGIYYKWKLARTNGEGNSEYKVGTDNEIGFRLFLYHGLQPTEGVYGYPSGAYPYGSFDNTNTLGDTIADLILDLSDKPASLYSKYWKNWLEFIHNGRPARLSLSPTLPDILEFDWERPLRGFCTSIGQAVLLPKRFKFTVTDCGIAGGSIEGLLK